MVGGIGGPRELENEYKFNKEEVREVIDLTSTLIDLISKQFEGRNLSVCLSTLNLVCYNLLKQGKGDRDIDYMVSKMCLGLNLALLNDVVDEQID